MQEIFLDTGTGRSSILVGEGLAFHLQSLPGNPVLLIDENVMRLHYEKFHSFRMIPIPQGEDYKNLKTAEKIYRELVHLEADRSSVIVAVGGGLTTDIAGFVASTYMRGIRFGFLPTTLLAQVDAGIGGKNGVNLDGYKNMIGVIKQPDFIWCDYTMLETLEDREYRAGIAEIIKYGAIRDRGLLNYMDIHMESLLVKNKPLLEEIITACIKIKADIVMKDELESGERRLLNFGHTVGHAIERNYRLLHGEAISIGMVIAAELSSAKGMIPDAEKIYLHQVLEKSGLPVSIGFDAKTIYETIRKDKKKEGTDIHFIFLRKLGEAVIGEISLDELKSMLYDLPECSE
ncbi:MAG TPA: 3-dehydroquinate synthase [Bacteroidaceae bacterium]|nr:3-dehydroquinate synthase [Bacteroidaceae bacterium]